MNGHRPALTLEIERVLGVGARQAVGAEFRYDPVLPLVVTAQFTVPGGPHARWHLGRDLLHSGLRAPSGHGAVRLRPSPDRSKAWLRLLATDTAALFELPAAPLATWLDHTYTLVPAGRELATVDWDATTTALLGGTAVPTGTTVK
ncbi:SsgA family sporulation/cell division regulator [Kitasatospora sp. NPDC097605]|uniref:SsgA family sporulation/cell division regulator n=1 Tax=Kitasatospora sp. NPDC097605 TaxID=3157226 RepID=UPI003320B277